MKISDFNHKSQLFILLINVKMPTNVGILTFMSRINFVLSRVEHDKSFINSEPLDRIRRIFDDKWIIQGYLTIFLHE